MIRKRYEVRGMMEWHPVFRIGRGSIQVSFTGGHLCGGGSTPASFETSDPVVQKVIEGSDAFRSERILLVMEDAALAPAGALTGAPDGAAVRMTALHDLSTVMEFKDIEEARGFLQDHKGISVDRVMTPKQCRDEARSMGIELIIKE